MFGKVAKVAGKVAMPLAIAGELYDISKAENKAAAAAKSIGGLGGAWAGAKLGASAGAGIGAFFGGIGAVPGAVIGSIVGGLGGYLGGKWIAGKVIEPAKPPEVKVPKDSMPATMGETSAILASFNANLQNLATDITEKMNGWAEQAWNITAVATAFAANLQEKATDIISKMGGWGEQAWNITAISTAFAANLQSKADSIIANGEALSSALAGATARAEALSVPSVGSVPTVAHAMGGMFNRPHMGLVAEAGPEVIIPLSSRLRDRALSLWQMAGDYLGVRPYASGGFAGFTPIPATIPSPAPSNIGGDINITVAGITVQLSNNELDEEAVALRIGWRILHEVKKKLENMS